MLRRAAIGARAFLETVWPDWHRERGMPLPEPLSRSTCARSSLFLCRVIADCGRPAQVCAGRYDGHLHLWVESGGYVVDITADQFGAEPVLIVAQGDPRYVHGDDPAFPEFKAKRQQTIDALWPRWLDAPERLALQGFG